MEGDLLVERGSTLIELLVGLFLLSLALLGAARGIRLLFESHVRISTARREFTSLFRAEQVLRETFKYLDSHRLDLPPRIHTGSLTFADGTPTPLSLRNDDLGPRLEHALTAVKLHSEEMIWLESVTQVRKPAEGSYEVLVRVCPPRALVSPLRSVLLLSVDTLYEARVTGAVEGESCIDIRALIEKSMVTQNKIGDGRELLLLRALIPVDSIHTLYISQAKTLRLASYAGEIVLENQPVVEEIEGLRLKLSQLPNPAAYVLEARVKSITGRRETLLFTHNLARVSLLELVAFARLL